MIAPASLREGGTVMRMRACSAALRRGLPAVLVACSMPAAFSQIMGKDVPFGYFTDKDTKIFQETLEGALEKNADGVSADWSNPDTKAHGQIKPLKTFERGGSPCRTATIANNAKGRSASGPFTFCKTAPGKWSLVPADPVGAK